MLVSIQYYTAAKLFTNRHGSETSNRYGLLVTRLLSSSHIGRTKSSDGSEDINSPVACIVKADTPTCRWPRWSTRSRMYLTIVLGGTGVTMTSSTAIDMPSMAGLPISRKCRSGRLELDLGAHFCGLRPATNCYFYMHKSLKKSSFAYCLLICRPLFQSNRRQTS